MGGWDTVAETEKVPMMMSERSPYSHWNLELHLVGLLVMVDASSMHDCTLRKETVLQSIHSSPNILVLVNSLQQDVDVPSQRLPHLGPGNWPMCRDNTWI